MSEQTTEDRVEGLEHVLAEQGSKLSQLSKDFIESHDGLDTRITTLHERLESLETIGESDEDSFRIVHNKIDQVEALIKASMTPAKPDRAKLYTALAAAQLEIENADANVDNEFLKTRYADLASCLNAVRKPLASNGLALIQLTEDESKSVLGIRTILAHESGQTIEDIITMAPPKLDPQGIGSCRTYMRRYALLAICGIAGAADDDAEGTKTDPDDYERITVSEVEKILYTADEVFGDKADAAVKKMLSRVFSAARVGDIKAGEAEVAITNLQNAAKLMKMNEESAKQAEKAEAQDAEDEK